MKLNCQFLTIVDSKDPKCPKTIVNLIKCLQFKLKEFLFLKPFISPSIPFYSVKIPKGMLKGSLDTLRSVKVLKCP